MYIPPVIDYQWLKIHPDSLTGGAMILSLVTRSFLHCRLRRPETEGPMNLVNMDRRCVGRRVTTRTPCRQQNIRRARQAPIH